MTMFAFLWQPKCLDSIRTKNCIRLGFSHISLSIFARRSNNLGKNVPGEAPRDIDSRQHTRKTGDAVENSSQTTLSTLQRINNDEREPDAPSPFQLTKRAVGRCNPREYSEEKRDNRIASERAAPIPRSETRKPDMRDDGNQTDRQRPRENAQDDLVSHRREGNGEGVNGVQSICDIIS